MVSGISLANKSQLLFGFAVICILTAALAVPWTRTKTLVEEYQLETSRQLAEAWLNDRIKLSSSVGRLGNPPRPLDEMVADAESGTALRMNFILVADVDLQNEDNPFPGDAVRFFQESEDETEFVREVEVDDQQFYRYALAIREDQYRSLRDGLVSIFSGGAFDPDLANPLRAILVVDRTSRFAERQLLISRVYIAAAGLIGSLLAILVFYLILTRLILRPVRKLRRTTEQVEQGALHTRSEIQTGDEFEQLSDSFNAMLDRMERSQTELQRTKENLDLKVNELAEANVGLFESNRVKSEFLANVSHELRTPLNSIIGFAELLDEMARSDAQSDPKRARYLSNILNSGRRLLEMINELLDMAKIEAGRMEITINATSVTDLLEGLAGIMRPQAETAGLELIIDTQSAVPVVETDAGKLQQILFNFLSNAIKFTPEGGTVTLGAERIRRQDNALGVRVSVTDTGPGIAYDMQEVIFDKFRQLDSPHTKQHPGTGLGLAICRELAEMLGATVSFASEPGHGATFYVDLPLTHQPEEPQPLMG